MNQSNENISSESIPSFLVKTYEILENPSYADIICWTKNGQGFVVKRVKEFAEKILPTHFRHSNYTSFVRQLNMYDFHKTRQQNQQNAFKNYMFKKGHRHLLKQIQRKDYKKNKQARHQTPNEKQQVQEKAQDKQAQHAKQFYHKWINELKSQKQAIQSKTLTLAQFKEVNIQQKPLMLLLDLLLSTKRVNKQSYLNINQFSQYWNGFMLCRQNSIKQSLQLDKHQHLTTSKTFNQIPHE